MECKRVQEWKLAYRDYKVSYDQTSVTGTMLESNAQRLFLLQMKLIGQLQPAGAKKKKSTFTHPSEGKSP